MFVAWRRRCISFAPAQQRRGDGLPVDHAPYATHWKKLPQRPVLECMFNSGDRHTRILPVSIGWLYGPFPGMKETVVIAGEDETLVILTGDSASNVLDDLTRAHLVVHAASPRVVVIKDSDSARTKNLDSIPDVTTVKGPDVPLAALVGLGDAEKLFVQAWSMRQAAPQKSRRGEGVDWGTDGFLPPDPPRGIERNQ